MKYLAFCKWELDPGEQQVWRVMKNYTETKLNAGKPWLCTEPGMGMTGLVGLQLEAENEEDAKKKMTAILEDYKRRDKEPNVWH